MLRLVTQNVTSQNSRTQLASWSTWCARTEDSACWQVNASMLPPQCELIESHSGRVAGSAQLACSPAPTHSSHSIQSQIRWVPLAASMQSTAASAARGCMKPANELHSITVESKLSQWPAGGDSEQVLAAPTWLSQLGSAARVGWSSVPGSISNHTVGSPECLLGSPSLERAGSTPPVSGVAAAFGWFGWLQAAAAKDAVNNKKRERSTCMSWAEHSLRPAGLSRSGWRASSHQRQPPYSAPMQTTQHNWTIIDGDAGVLSYTYKFGREGEANCFTARLRSGGLLVISPPRGISDAELADLAAFGEVEAIVANNGFHHLGIGHWREKFPRARCFAAPGAAKRIAKRSKHAGELEPLAELQPLLADGVAVVEAPASKAGETWAWAKIADGYAWYASDVLANMQLPSALIPRLLFKLSDNAPGYKVFSLALWIIIKDKKRALGAMLDDVRTHPPTVMVPAHGEILSHASLATETEQLLGDAIG